MTRAAFIRAEPDARRHALIGATAACLAQHGIAGTTVRAICAKAGVSPGLLRHYFPGVDALIAATYRAVTATVDDALDEAVAAAGDDPRARLNAYVTASFRPPIATAWLLATWTAFWSLVRSNEEVAAIHAETYGDFRADLEALLIPCGLPASQARQAAIALTALIDGLWLELSLDAQSFSAEEAEAMAIGWVDRLLAG